MQDTMVQDAVASGAASLTNRFETLVQLRLVETLQSSDRTAVYRCAVQNPSQAVPPTVIIKQARQPYGTRFDDAIDGNVWNDWAGLLFLSKHLPPDIRIPKCYSAAQRVGLIVLEDLGDDPSLRDVLTSGTAEQAASALVRCFSALGQVHAATAGKEAIFHATRRMVGFYDPQQEFYQQQYTKLPRKFHALCQALHLTPHREVDNELGSVVATLTQPGMFSVYLHGDPSPTNVIVSDNRLSLIDFEYGTFSHALLEGVQARLLFPSSGFVQRIPEPILRQMETAYRTELTKGCSQAADDELYGQALVAATAYWAINFAVWLSFSALLEHDQRWGSSTMRQRIMHRSRIFAQLVEEVGYLPRLGTTFSQITAKLTTLWPEAVDSLTLYPAFSSE